MANIVLNDSLGRIAEIIADGADLILIPLSASDADATMKDGYGAGNPTLLSDFLAAAGNTEQTAGGWGRKVILNAALTIVIDDTADTVRVQVPDQTYVGPTAANNTTKLVPCVDGANDGVREVLTSHDFAVTADGNDVVADFDPATGFWRSS